MIADLDETIRELLRAELPIKNGEIDISFDLPKHEWSGRLNKPTVNLYLYDVRENPTLRQHQWEQLQNGNGHGKQGDHLARLKRLPFRVDCFYLLTTWANDSRDEHRLLTRCLLALFRYPILPEDRLVGTLRNPRFEIQARVAVHDRLTNPAEVWSALDNEMRPSVPYILTITLDPWSEVTGEVVRNLTIRPYINLELPRYIAPTDEQKADALNYIGGTIRNKQADNAPCRDIEVAIKGTGLFAKTDQQGRYRLGNLPLGAHTLVVWPPDGKPKEKQITIPPVKGEDYDLDI
jgi:hypothetical protein